MDKIFVISDRGGSSFLDPNQLSEQSHYTFINREGKNDTLTQEAANDYLNSLKGKRVLLLVHGYNATTMAESYFTVKDGVEQLDSDASFTTRMVQKVYHYLFGTPVPTGPYDAVIGYAWPCFESRLAYLDAKENAQAVVPRIHEHLSQLTGLADKVDVVAHSMGNFSVFEALKDPNAIKHPIRNLFSLAPAVDYTSIDINNPYYDVHTNCDNLYVFKCDKDFTLKWFYPMIENNYALGYTGVLNTDNIAHNVQQVDCSNVVEGHSNYPETKALYHFIQENLMGRYPSSHTAVDVKLWPNEQFEVLKNRVIAHQPGYLSYVTDKIYSLFDSIGLTFSTLQSA